MGEYDKSMEYMKIQFEIEARFEKVNKWSQFYYGLLNNKLGNEEIAKNALWKSVEYTTNLESYEYVVEALKVMKNNHLEIVDLEYFNRFEKLLNDKFGEEHGHSHESYK